MFSGIGGFDLAAQWMGWDNVFHCEKDEFCQQVLKHHFPNSHAHDDITRFDATQYMGRVDILTGGFPCQPYSNAGKRLGKDDDRHLWPQMLRVIREVQPSYVVGENVSGLVSWNDGLVFEEVQTDLENEGYEVQAYILPACGVDAPHRRDRVWFVAHRDEPNEGEDGGGVQRASKEIRGREESVVLGSPGCDGDATDTQRIRLEHGKKARDVRGLQEKESGRGCESTNAPEAIGDKPNVTDTQVSRGAGERFEGQGQVQLDGRSGKNMEAAWENFPTFSPVCGGDDGLPRVLDGITFPKWRRESIKAYGNAIVPQVALQIFQAIESTRG